MKLSMTTLALVALTGAPALAAGDVEAGAKVFNQCQTCHIVANEAGEVLAGRNAKTGPNLYAVIGRTAGTYEGFRYGDAIVAAGEKGLIWDEATFVDYVQDPATFLKTYLDDKSAKSLMVFKVRKEVDAQNLYAFLVSLAPVPAEGAAEGGAAAPAAPAVSN